MFGKKLKTSNTPEELAALEQTLESRRGELASQLEAARMEAAEAALEALADEKASVTAASRRVAALQADLAATVAAISGVRSRREEAIAQVFRDEAESFRRRAEAALSQAERIEAECTEPLARLSRLQGVQYEAGILQLQPDQTGTRYVAPRSELLRAEAGSFTQQAEAVVAREVPKQGTVQANGAAALLEQVLQNARHIAPTAEAVTAWTEACERVLATHHAHEAYVLQSIPQRLYRLVWSDGEIDTAASTVTLTNTANNGFGYSTTFGPYSYTLKGRVG